MSMNMQWQQLMTTANIKNQSEAFDRLVSTFKSGDRAGNKEALKEVVNGPDWRYQGQSRHYEL